MRHLICYSDAELALELSNCKARVQAIEDLLSLRKKGERSLMDEFASLSATEQQKVRMEVGAIEPSNARRAAYLKAIDNLKKLSK